jgi:hypothetical protein
MANIKGNALSGFKRQVATRQGSKGMERWLSELDPGDAALMQGLILPNHWYPLRLWNLLADRYVEVFGGGDPQSFRPVAESIAEDDLHAFFKVLLKASSPAMIMRRAGSLWDRYFDVGTMDSIELRANRFLVRLTGPRSIDRGPGLVTCAAGVPGWQERTLSLTGARGVRSVQTACRFQGAPACEFSVTWL